MPQGPKLTHADRLALRRLCTRHRNEPRKLLGRLISASPATVVRMLKGIPKTEGKDGSYPTLRSLYVDESGDTTEYGWRVVWDRSQLIENERLSQCLTEFLTHEKA